jgi:hypothetical protein
LAMTKLSENNPKREDNSKKEELLRFIWERENYTHGIIWKAEDFFVVLVSGLIAAGISVFPISLLATFVVVTIAFVMTLLGDYVLRKESRYFVEYRYARIKLQKDLGYDEDYKDVINEFSEDLPSKDEYVKKWAMPKKGVRHAFSMVYLFQAILCIVITLALTFQVIGKLIPTNWLVLHSYEVIQSVIGFMLFIIMIISLVLYRARVQIASKAS